MPFYNTSYYSAIQVSDIPLGEGGEGKVYEVLSPANLHHFVIKIYHIDERTPEREAKLQYLKANRPPLLNDFSVIWIEDLVYENQQFVGFLMPKAISGVDLTYLTGLQISDKLSVDWLEKYSRHTIQGFQNRAKLCYNIASAVSQIHQNGHYVLVDFKPENLKVKLNGQVSLLDIDSVQVIENERVIFPAQKLSPEYSPAEIKQLSLGTDYIPETWDRFSLAVVFYKVLFGLHPFAVTGKNEYQKLDSHEQKIQAGLFPFGEKSADIQVVPPPHANFEALPFDIRMLFIRAFAAGYNLPTQRPSANEWCSKLADFQPISQNYQSPTKTIQKPQPNFEETKIAKPRNSNEPSGVMAYLVIVLVIFAIIVSSFNRMDWLDFSTANKFDKYRIKDKQEIQNIHKELEDIYRDVFYLGNNYFRVRKESGLYGVVDADNQIRLPFEYEYVTNFYNGYAIFEKNNKYGVFNEMWQIIIPNEFQIIQPIEEGLFLARNYGKYGYLKPNGKIAIPFEFDDAHIFTHINASKGGGNSKAWVKKDGNEFYIDKTGNCIEFCP